MRPIEFSWGNPTCLYRAFTCREYAEQFIEFGRFRMMHIMNYTVSDNATVADKEEGLWSWSGIDGSGGRYCSPHPAYLFCLSGPEVCLNHLRRYGKYIVKILDPGQFAKDISEYIRQPVRIDCIKIAYRDIAQLSQRPERSDAFRCTYSEKPSRFANDCEYRIVAVSEGIGAGCLGYAIELGKKLKYAELLST